jgi:hypothetical protein
MFYILWDLVCSSVIIAKLSKMRWCINNQKVILPLSPFLLRRSCLYPDGNRHAEIGHDIHGSDAGMNLDDLGLENTGSQLIAK